MNAILMTKLAIAAMLAMGVAACSRDDRTTQAPEQPPPAAEPVTSTATPETWIDRVLISSATPGAAAPAEGLTAGEPIQISMDVADAPAGTTVTTYWYGPDNRPLAYESKTLGANQHLLIFKEENTFGWKAGDYRAEIWIGDRKLEEESFRIAG